MTAGYGIVFNGYQFGLYVGFCVMNDEIHGKERIGMGVREYHHAVNAFYMIMSSSSYLGN
jgi:hypothetical protein